GPPGAGVSGGGAGAPGRDGLSRGRRVAFEAGRDREIRVVFPPRERYRFAAIGDTGGRGELRWCFQRAAELGADFILHVGDIAYYDGDFEAAAAAFREAAVPVYAAVGNHDFYGGTRYRFRYFQEHFGPMNGAFELAGVYFVNLDTAADLVPASGGRRGELLAELGASPPPGPLVVFTHRPFADPRVLEGKREDSHALNRAAEANWLRKRLLEMGADVMLAGHIHASFDFDDQGLRTVIAGDGLGVRGGKATILIGEFEPGRPVELRWEPLNMPESAWSPEYAEDRRQPAQHDQQN
ncbi:MAG: metallophosphoesterase, partial [Planctomycetes bacterium]|nr:metallophosphoesterase [Planctomycetota bacterium]